MIVVPNGLMAGAGFLGGGCAGFGFDTLFVGVAIMPSPAFVGTPLTLD
jgi:hypothetical protein